MSFLAVSIHAEPQSVLAAAGVLAGYSAVGTLVNPCRIFLLQNLTDAAVQFSFDAVNDHFPLAAGATLIIDLNSNRSNSPCMGSVIPARTTVYAKRIGVPATGSIYLTPFYGFDGI